MTVGGPRTEPRRRSVVEALRARHRKIAGMEAGPRIDNSEISLMIADTTAGVHRGHGEVSLTTVDTAAGTRRAHSEAFPTITDMAE